MLNHYKSSASWIREELRLVPKQEIVPQKIFQKPLDKLETLWYNKDVKRTKQLRVLKVVSFGVEKNLKKLKKPLDKRNKLMYNKDVNKQNKTF